MYGETIGKIVTAADNIVYEINDQNNICIVLDFIPEASIHIRDTLLFIPKVYTPDTSIKEFNLSVPLEESLDIADKYKAGEAYAIKIPNYSVPFLQLGSSIDKNVQLVLSVNRIIENNFALTKYKDNHPMARDIKYLRHPVIGWKITGDNKDSLTEKIIEASLKQPKGEYKPTLNHLAWIKEATSEIKYLAGKVFK